MSVGAPLIWPVPTELVLLGALLRGALVDVAEVGAELLDGATLELVALVLPTEVVVTSGGVDGCPEVGGRRIG